MNPAAETLNSQRVDMTRDNQPDSGMTMISASELLRTKGRVLLSMSNAHGPEAEQCFRQALDWSRRQGALAWELRAAVDYAALFAAQGKVCDARLLLQPIVGKFVDGCDTADLKTAARLLATL